MTNTIPSASEIDSTQKLVLDTLLLPLRNAGMTCFLSFESGLSDSNDGSGTLMQHRIYSSACGYAPMSQTLEEQMKWQLKRWEERKEAKGQIVKNRQLNSNREKDV